MKEKILTRILDRLSTKIQALISGSNMEKQNKQKLETTIIKEDKCKHKLKRIYVGAKTYFIIDGKPYMDLFYEKKCSKCDETIEFVKELNRPKTKSVVEKYYEQFGLPIYQKIKRFLEGDSINPDEHRRTPGYW